MRILSRRAPEGELDFAEFVREASSRLLRTAYLLGGGQQVAEDLVQEALGGSKGTSAAWGLDLTFTVDGRSYAVDVVPRPAATSTTAGPDMTTDPVSAVENVDGLGITVTTDGKEGSPTPRRPPKC